jgi:hypothetical protein
MLVMLSVSEASVEILRFAQNDKAKGRGFGSE